MDGIDLGLLAIGIAGMVCLIAALWLLYRLPERPSVRELSFGATSTVDPFETPTWAGSGERQTYIKRRVPNYFSAVGGACLIFTGAVGVTHYSHPFHGWAAGILVAGAVVVLYSTVPYIAARAAFLERRRATASARVDKAVNELANPAHPLSLASLFVLNRQQLDQYQEMTKRQQRSAFLLTQIASVVAFLVLVAGVVLALRGTGVEKYIAGGLSGLGSLLSTYLAKTFFQAHRDANKQLNLYYLEPQRTGRLLAAERLAGTPPTPELITQMINRVLMWEMPSKGKSGGAGGQNGSLDGSAAATIAGPQGGANKDQ